MRLCPRWSLRLRINRLGNGGRALFAAGIICRGSMGSSMMGSSMMITCGNGGAKNGVGNPWWAGKLHHPYLTHLLLEYLHSRLRLLLRFVHACANAATDDSSFAETSTLSPNHSLSA